jgi:hypothetical protein
VDIDETHMVAEKIRALRGITQLGIRLFFLLLVMKTYILISGLGELRYLAL